MGAAVIHGVQEVGPRVSNKMRPVLSRSEVAILAVKIFEDIEFDLRDRRGIRHEWDQVDEEVQKEIRTTNQKRIASRLWPLLGEKP